MRLLTSFIAAALFAAAITIMPGAVAQSGRASQQKPPPPEQPQDKRKDDTIRIDTDLVTLTTPS